MFSKALTFFFLVSASAESFTDGADDSNLMQATAYSTSKRQGLVQQQLDKVEETFNSFQWAPARKNVTQNMLKMLKKSDMPLGQSFIVEQVITLLESVLDEMMSERDGDQEDLDDFLTAQEDCEGEWAGENESYKNISDTYEDLHEGCRNNEQQYHADEDLYCGNLEDFLGSLSPPTCTPPHGKTRADTAAWDVYVTDGESWFDTWQPQYLTKVPNCSDAISALENQRTLCRTKQVTFEQKYCDWMNHHHQMCAHIDNCYQNKVADHMVHVNRIKPVADRRCGEAQQIKYVNCLLQELIDADAGARDINLDECSRIDIGESEIQAYNQTYPEVHDIVPCENASLPPTPGGDLWYEFAYGDFEDDQKPEEDTGVTCVDPPPTTQ